MRALEIDPALCRRHAEKFSWEACSLQFLQNLTANQKPKPDQSS